MEGAVIVSWAQNVPDVIPSTRFLLHHVNFTSILLKARMGIGRASWRDLHGDACSSTPAGGTEVLPGAAPLTTHSVGPREEVRLDSSPAPPLRGNWVTQEPSISPSLKCNPQRHMTESLWPGPVQSVTRTRGGDQQPWSWVMFLTGFRGLPSLPDGQRPRARGVSGSPDSPLQLGYPNSRPWPDRQHFVRAPARNSGSAALLPDIRHRDNRDGAWGSAFLRVPLVS